MSLRGLQRTNRPAIP